MKTLCADTMNKLNPVMLRMLGLTFDNARIIIHHCDNVPYMMILDLETGIEHVYDAFELDDILKDLD